NGLRAAARSTEYPPGGGLMNMGEMRLPVRRTRLTYLIASLFLLIPCYWQPRLQAGDLSSHVYNAWLAQLIESGRADGLMIVRQTTNVLFDLLLSGCFRLFGADWAQRIAVSVAVRSEERRVGKECG